MATLPSWITSIDPVAGVSRLLQGFGLGAQVGESQRRGEQADIELANRASQFNQELAQKEASALREYDLAKQLEKAKAETAARNLSGMYEYQQLIASGVPKEQALMKAAPNLFYRQPDKMMGALHDLDVEKRAQSEADAMTKYREAQATHWQNLEKKPTALQQDLDYLTDVYAQSLGRELTPEERAQYKNTLGTSKLLGPKRTTEIGPDGTVRIIEGGTGQASDLTVANKTKLNEALINAESPIAAINHMEKNMRSTDFGIAGNIGDFMDKYAAQLVPNAADPRRISVRNSMKLLRTDLYKTMRSDGNIAEAERKQIEGMLPAEGFGESLPDAATKLINAKRRLVSASRDAASRLGKTPPIWAWTPEEIGHAWAKKTLSEVDAVRALRKFYPETINQLGQ